MIALKLACGHKVATNIEPMQQYADDTNFVWCPSCRKAGDKRIPLDWQEIVGVYPVSTGLPQVLPSEILRLQPKVTHAARRRPFPYTFGRTGVRGRGRG